MGKIITVVEAVEGHFRRCAKEARSRFGEAVRPLYAPDSQGRPEVVASAGLVEIKGRRFLATAAHALHIRGMRLRSGDNLIPMPTAFFGSVGKGERHDTV